MDQPLGSPKSPKETIDSILSLAYGRAIKSAPVSPTNAEQALPPDVDETGYSSQGTDNLAPEKDQGRKPSRGTSPSAEMEEIEDEECNTLFNEPKSPRTMNPYAEGSRDPAVDQYGTHPRAHHKGNSAQPNTILTYDAFLNVEKKIIEPNQTDRGWGRSLVRGKYTWQLPDTSLAVYKKYRSSAREIGKRSMLADGKVDDGTRLIFKRICIILEKTNIDQLEQLMRTPTLGELVEELDISTDLFDPHAMNCITLNPEWNRIARRFQKLATDGQIARDSWNHNSMIDRATRILQSVNTPTWLNPVPPSQDDDELVDPFPEDDILKFNHNYNNPLDPPCRCPGIKRVIITHYNRPLITGLCRRAGETEEDFINRRSQLTPSSAQYPSNRLSRRWGKTIGFYEVRNKIGTPSSATNHHPFSDSESEYEWNNATREEHRSTGPSRKRKRANYNAESRPSTISFKHFRKTYFDGPDPCSTEGLTFPLCVESDNKDWLHTLGMVYKIFDPLADLGANRKVPAIRELWLRKVFPLVDIYMGEDRWHKMVPVGLNIQELRQLNHQHGIQDTLKWLEKLSLHINGHRGQHITDNQDEIYYALDFLTRASGYSCRHLELCIPNFHPFMSKATRDAMLTSQLIDATVEDEPLQMGNLVPWVRFTFLTTIHLENIHLQWCSPPLQGAASVSSPVTMPLGKNLQRITLKHCYMTQLRSWTTFLNNLATENRLIRVLEIIYPGIIRPERWRPHQAFQRAYGICMAEDCKDLAEDDEGHKGRVLKWHDFCNPDDLGFDGTGDSSDDEWISRRNRENTRRAKARARFLEVCDPQRFHTSKWLGFQFEFKWNEW